MKTDLTKVYKSYYTAKTKPQLLTLEKAAYIAINGQGDPSEKEFAATLEALYPVAYAIKFMCKAINSDFTVPKLEGLWWFDETKYRKISIAETPQKVPRSEWNYRLLLRLPDFVSKKQVELAVQQVVEKKKLQKAAEVYYYEMTEGRCLQMLPVGPFEKEPETLEKMHTFMFDNNLHKNGLHHEIYLSNFRKTAADKLRTILREPIK